MNRPALTMQERIDQRAVERDGVQPDTEVVRQAREDRYRCHYTLTAVGVESMMDQYGGEPEVAGRLANLFRVLQGQDQQAIEAAAHSLFNWFDAQAHRIAKKRADDPNGPLPEPVNVIPLFLQEQAE